MCVALHVFICMGIVRIPATVKMSLAATLILTIVLVLETSIALAFLHYQVLVRGHSAAIASAASELGLELITRAIVVVDRERFAPLSPAESHSTVYPGARVVNEVASQNLRDGSGPPGESCKLSRTASWCWSPRRHCSGSGCVPPHPEM